MTTAGNWASRPLIAGLGILVLACEYLALAFAFDLAPALERPGAWAELGLLREVAIVVVVAVAISMTFGIFIDESHSPPKVAAASRKRFAVAHALAYALLLLGTWHVFGRAKAPDGSVGLWVGLWLATGFTTVATLALTCFGPGFLTRDRVVLLILSLALAAAGVVVGSTTRDHADIFGGRTALQLAAWFLHLGYDEVMADPQRQLLGAGGFTVWIQTGCAGVEGVGLASVLVPAYLFAFRRRLRFPNALLLIPLAILGVFIGNAARIATLVWVGAEFDPELAVGAFHSKLGWIFFCSIVLGVSALGQRMPIFAKGLPPASTAALGNPTAAFLLPLMALIGTAQITGLFAEDYDPLYWVRIAAASCVAWIYRREYGRLLCRPSLFALLVGLGVGVGWMLIGVLPAVAPPEHIGPAWIAMRAIGSATVVPLVEELAFRGFTLRRLQSSEFWDVPYTKWTLLAVLVSSVLFGALHQRWIAATIAGALYALVQIRSGRLGDAIFAHAASNAVIAAWAVSTGNWAEW